MRAASAIIVRRLLVLGVMLMMLFPTLGLNVGPFVIQERIQALARPAQIWSGLVSHEWQSYLEQRFLFHIGSSRAFMLLLHNEIKHRLFPTRPNDHYIWTPEFGYYAVDSIRRLNDDVLRKEIIDQHYQRAANRVRVLQEILRHHGVALLVVTPPPKARVYPEHVSSYLVSPTATILDQAISYGNVLAQNGVNVVDVQRIFSERKASSPWPFFTTTSFHWSVWAACGITSDILIQAQALTGKDFFKIYCSDIAYGKSFGVDTDIASILNIFSTDAVIGAAPFPKISPQVSSLEESRKILVIGDSFSDQIVYALTQALPDTGWSPGWLTRYDGFVSRQTFGMGGRVTSQVPLLQAAALPEVLSKELLLMVVSDGSVYRDPDNLNQMEFGATRVLLDGLLSRADSGVIEPKKVLVDGWRAVGSTQWRTSGHSASFAVRPPVGGKRLELMLDVENFAPDTGKPRSLDILVDGKLAGQAPLARGRRGVLAIKLSDRVQWKDPLVAEITLRDAHGHPLNLLLHGVRVPTAEQGMAANLYSKKEDAVVPTVPNPAEMRTINLISNEEPEDILVDGLSGLESNDKENWRWALGPATRVKFYVDPALSNQARQVLLKFAFKNGMSLPDQTVTIRLNGTEIRRYSSDEIAQHELTVANVVLNTKKGVNQLEISYGDWNHGRKSYGSNDPRKLAIVVMGLSLQGASK